MFLPAGLIILTALLLWGCDDKPEQVQVPEEPKVVAPPAVVVVPDEPPAATPRITGEIEPRVTQLDRPLPPAPIPRGTRFNSKYDEDIRGAARKWLPMVQWKLLKAQYFQESRLDPAARSPAGAEGIGQFMPATWVEVSRQMQWGTLPRSSAKHSIEAGAYYMSTLYLSWKSERPLVDRYNLALVSYNAGMGNILKSQQRCGMPTLFEPIMACLHLVTGHHAVETRGYVPSIRKWHLQMETEP